MGIKSNKNFLVALINNKRDFDIAVNYNWYRIPYQSKMVPKIVQDKSVEYIAFYQSKVFDEESYRVERFAKVSNISIVKRKELFPRIFNDPKAEDLYYKISFSPLIKISTPIISRKFRRLLFISTSETHFHNAREINDLFYESPIEEKMWEYLKSANICAERQLLYRALNKNLYLDFALYCHSRNINIECDGDEYHLRKENVLYDKKRNNFLESHGWSVLRFSTSDILNNKIETIERIKVTINQCGGLESSKDYKYQFFETVNNPSLFFDSSDNSL